MALKSMHGFVQKFWSSAATCASAITCGILSKVSTRRSSAAKVASSTPSADITLEPWLSSKCSSCDGSGNPLAYDAKTATTPMKSAAASAAKTPRIIAGRGAMPASAPALGDRGAGGLLE
jgi:hypothetical protein